MCLIKQVILGYNFYIERLWTATVTWMRKRVFS